MLSFEIGRKGQMHIRTAVEAAEAALKGALRNPDAVISASVGGYSDDPREVWEIPEAVELFLAFAKHLAILETRIDHPVSRQLSQPTRSIILLCLSVRPDEGAGMSDIVRNWFKTLLREAQAETKS